MNPDARSDLKVENVYTAYDRADVLENVSLEAKSGKITCLLGSNGAGKTTLIRSILSLTAPHRGRIGFAGVQISGLSTHKVIATGIACIPEGRKVFPKCTVEENLRLGAYQETSADALAERLNQVYETFPVLRERHQQLAGTMSGGEQAMISIGRGLMRAPKLLLIDEPSLGLSPILVKENFRIIQRHCNPLCLDRSLCPAGEGRKAKKKTRPKEAEATRGSETRKRRQERQQAKIAFQKGQTGRQIWQGG